MSDWKAILKQEFEAEDGSFLLKLRVEREWDRDAFERVLSAMEDCCRATAGKKTVDRWLAEGFWLTTAEACEFVFRDVVSRDHGKDDYRDACGRINEVAALFFAGEVVDSAPAVYYDAKSGTWITR